MQQQSITARSEQQTYLHDLVVPRLPHAVVRHAKLFLAELQQRALCAVAHKLHLLACSWQEKSLALRVHRAATDAWDSIQHR